MEHHRDRPDRPRLTAEEVRALLRQAHLRAEEVHAVTSDKSVDVLSAYRRRLPGGEASRSMQSGALAKAQQAGLTPDELLALLDVALRNASLSVSEVQWVLSDRCRMIRQRRRPHGQFSDTTTGCSTDSAAPVIRRTDASGQDGEEPGEQ